MMGKFKPGISDCRTHAITTFAHSRIGQPHHAEVGQAEGNVHFDVNRVGIDPEYGGAAKAGEHDANDQCKIGRSTQSFEIARIRRWLSLECWNFRRAERAWSVVFLRGYRRWSQSR
jgi:hypothetical protein